ncbi:MAG: glycosyltransferase family 1 protein [Terracidiphilus sp.]
MKILIAAASFASNMSGLQRHALNVARCLLPEPEISSLCLVIAPWQRNFLQAEDFHQNARIEIHIAEMDRSSISRNLWYYRRLPELAVRLRADLVHLSYPMPVNATAFRCPTLVTLHDLYPYEVPMNFGFPKFIFNRMVLQQCLRNVDAIACVSETTRLRLRQYAPIAARQKAVRIYNCVEAEPVSNVQPPVPILRGERFLLCVAQHRRNKNIPLLVRAFSRMLRAGDVVSNMKLVIIGIAGPETRKIHRLVATLGLGPRVRFLEGVSESELQWCYMRCEAVVSPSFTEGFGLPIVEALLAGCRIVCSDIPAFREVGDGQCRFVALDESAEETLAVAIVAALNEPKGSPRTLEQFSAPVLAKQYISLYRRLITSAVFTGNAAVDASLNATASGRLPL